MVGIPISSQECMVRLSFLYLTSVTNRLGVNAAAAVGIASKYDVFAMLPATSIASALAAITPRTMAREGLNGHGSPWQRHWFRGIGILCLFPLGPAVSPDHDWSL